MDGRIHPVVVDRGLGRHHRRHQAAREQAGCTGLRVGSAVGHLEVDDGPRAGTQNESFPKPTEIGGYAGVPQAPAPPPSATAPPTPSETVIQPTIEVAPGITIPIGPPTTVPLARRVPCGPAHGLRGAPPAGPAPPP